MQIIRPFSKKTLLIKGTIGDWVAMRDHERH